MTQVAWRATSAGRPGHCRPRTGDSIAAGDARRRYHGCADAELVSGITKWEGQGAELWLHHQHPYEHMNFVIEGEGALVNESGEETPLKAGDFALVNPDEKHQYRNKGNTPFKMICGVPKEFE